MLLNRGAHCNYYVETCYGTGLHDLDMACCGTGIPILDRLCSTVLVFRTSVDMLSSPPPRVAFAVRNVGAVFLASCNRSRYRSSVQAADGMGIIIYSRWVLMLIQYRFWWY